MNSLHRHELVNDFLKMMCTPIKAKELHKEIRLEMESHLYELVVEKTEDGVEREEAIRLSIAEMGDPLQLGQQLNAAHQPRYDWSLIALITFFAAIGLIAMYEVQIADPNRWGESYFVKKVVYACTGMAVMIAVSFWDYRKLKPYSWHLFALTLMFMIFVNIWGIQIQGVRSSFRFGPITIDIIAAAPYLLLVSLAGIISELKRKKFVSSYKAIGLTALPSLLFIQSPDISSLLIYIFGLTVLLVYARIHWVRLLLMLSPFLVLLFANSIYSRFFMMRLTGFLHAYSDPLGSGYMTIQSIKAIQSGGMWGQGFGVTLRTLPLLNNEMLFTYLIYSLGWMVGLAIFAGALYLIVRLLKVTEKIGDTYGKMLMIGLVSMYGIQFFWNMFMSFGLLPIMGISLPFIGAGGTQMLIQFATIGMIFSVYRQKDQIRRLPNPSSP